MSAIIPFCTHTMLLAWKPLVSLSANANWLTVNRSHNSLEARASCQALLNDGLYTIMVMLHDAQQQDRIFIMPGGSFWRAPLACNGYSGPPTSECGHRGRDLKPQPELAMYAHERCCSGIFQISFDQQVFFSFQFKASCA